MPDVAGTDSGVGNNNIGIAGVAPKAKIVPVRVLGACGGYDSDIIDDKAVITLFLLMGRGGARISSVCEDAGTPVFVDTGDAGAA